MKFVSLKTVVLCLVAAVVVGLMASFAQAGPIQNIRSNIQERRENRQQSQQAYRPAPQSQQVQPIIQTREGFMVIPAGGAPATGPLFLRDHQVTPTSSGANCTFGGCTAPAPESNRVWSGPLQGAVFGGGCSTGSCSGSSGVFRRR